MQLVNNYQNIKEKLFLSFDLLNKYKFLPTKIGSVVYDSAEIDIHKKNLD